MTTRVFVYGTLKSGHGNNRLLRTAELVGSAITEEAYGFYRSGIPFMHETPLEGHEAVRVSGEMYDVDATTLKALDGLEGHPRWYRRKVITVIDRRGQGSAAYAYFMQGEPAGHCYPITSGNY
jgi:gamma-glutamylaminecyclotransferase